MDFLRLCGLFAALDVRKLIVRQVKADDRHVIFNASLVLFQHFGIHIGRWRFFGSIHNIPKIHGCQQHFDFELLIIKLSSIKFVNDSSCLTFK